MRIGVIYDFCKRGGDYVMINMLQALSSDGHDLHLMTTCPNGVEESFRFFGVRQKINGLKVRSCRVPPFLPHPYSVAYITRKVEKHYDLLLLSDDVPKNLTNKVISYVHYPHAARVGLNSLIGRRYKTTFKGRMKWSAHKKLFPQFFFVKEIPDNVLLLANSSLTRKHIRDTLNPKDLAIVYPPVDSARIHQTFQQNADNKKNIAVFVGKFEPEKKIDDILQAAKLTKDKLGLKFRIVGFSGNEAYLKKISTKLKKFGLEDTVELLPDVEREACINHMVEAKFIIHPTPHEPFGISVVEGMAGGCLPIVKKGFNGPWIDITERGRYGIGYEDTQNLANILEAVTNKYDEFKLKSIISKALEFDKENFKVNFLKAVEPFLEERG